jgi:hypothetical protein
MVWIRSRNHGEGGGNCPDQTRLSAHFCRVRSPRYALETPREEIAGDVENLVEETMTAATGERPQQEPSQRQPERRVDLGVRYGAIGISAVAAAARYAGGAKPQAYAQADYRIEERFEEAAVN